MARFARPLTLVAHGAARACVNVPPGCGESSGGRRRPGRARRELEEARQSLVSERATFAGGVGSLADSDGRVISRFLKRDITVLHYEQWAQGVVERLADKGRRLAARCQQRRMSSQSSPGAPELAVAPDKKNVQTIDVSKMSVQKKIGFDQREGRGLDVLIRGGVLRLQLILVQSDLPR